MMIALSSMPIADDYAATASGYVLTGLITVVIAMLFYIAKSFGNSLTGVANVVDKLGDTVDELSKRVAVLDDRSERRDDRSEKRDVRSEQRSDDYRFFNARPQAMRVIDATQGRSGFESLTNEEREWLAERRRNRGAV